MGRNGFARYAWATLAYNLLVILWGAVVRATGSGAGCGSHWPLCNGEIVQRAPSVEMLIEYSHRLTSGVALISVVILVIWAYRRYARGHVVRRAAAYAMFFMVTEALVGAGLVLLEYVAFDQSVARAYWMAAHLINTFLLLAAITLTAWWAAGNKAGQWRQQGIVGGLLLLSGLALLLLGSSGAVTALGDTLAIRGGISPADSAYVARLVDLRIYHPLLSFVVGAIVALAAWVAATQRPSPQTARLSRILVVLFVVQLLVGALNVVLKAPVIMQLVHLLVADALWILWVLLGAAALAVERPSPQRAPVPAAARGGD